MTRFVDLSTVSRSVRLPDSSQGDARATRVYSARLRYPGAPDVSALPLEALARVPGVRIDASVSRQQAVDVLLPVRALRGRAVLVRTGVQEHSTAARSRDGPHLSRRTAELFIEGEVTLVGLDFGAAEDSGAVRSAVALLLGCEIPVVEHLRGLHRLPARGFWFTAVPEAVHGAPTVPVRAFAELPGA